MLSLSVLKMKYILSSFWLQRQLISSKNKSTITCKELLFQETPAVVKDHPPRTWKDMIILICLPSLINMPCLAVQLFSQVPKTCNLNLLDLAKSRRRELLCVPGARALGTNTELIANSLSVSWSTEVAQDNGCVGCVLRKGPPAQYEVEFG